MSFLMRLGLKLEQREEGPLRDLLEKIKNKSDDFRKFWRTRKHVLSDLSIADQTSEELARSGLMTPWKFNLFQSALAGAPALIVKAVLDYWVPPDRPQGIDAQVNSVFAWLWPICDPVHLLGPRAYDRMGFN
jgi:hypothetical protein